MLMLKKAIIVCVGVVLGLMWAIGSMHEPRHVTRDIPPIADPTGSIECVNCETVFNEADADIKDMADARAQARAAYYAIIRANDRALFDPTSLYKKP